MENSIVFSRESIDFSALTWQGSGSACSRAARHACPWSPVPGALRTNRSSASACGGGWFPGLLWSRLLAAPPPGRWRWTSVGSPAAPSSTIMSWEALTKQYAKYYQLLSSSPFALCQVSIGLGTKFQKVWSWSRAVSKKLKTPSQSWRLSIKVLQQCSAKFLILLW